MEKVKMPDKDKLYKCIQRILEKGYDVEIRPKADGEVYVYMLERKKQKIEL